jgi:MFS family permease
VTATPTTAARSRLGLLRHPDFLKLWTGETISQFGTQVSNLAVPLIAALFLKVTPFEFGLIGTVEFLPFILLSLPAGVWVDRLHRRPILIVGDLGRAISLLSIPIAFELNVLTIWQLYAVGFINGCLTVFFDVSYQSYLPSLVERDEILEGNSKLEVSRSAAQLLGPGIAGFLIGILTAPIAVIVDSISFLGSAVFVFGIRKKEPPLEPPKTADGKHPSMRSEVKAGLNYVLNHPYLRYIAACTATSNLFSQFVFAILLLYLVQPPLNLGAEQIGLAFSLAAIGFLLGAVLANRFGKWIGVGPTIIASAVIFGPSAIFVAIAPPDLIMPAAVLSLFLGGFGGAVYNINQVSFRQAITPPRMQGRMNATMRFIVWGTIPIGSILGGFLGGVIGLHQTIWIGAIGGAFSAVPLFFAPLLSLKEMPAPVGNEEQTEPEIAREALDETPRFGLPEPNVLMSERTPEANELATTRLDEPPAAG